MIFILLMHPFHRAIQTMEQKTKARKVRELDIPFVALQHKMTDL